MEVNGYRSIAPDMKVGHNIKILQFINLYGCEVGDEKKSGRFEIQKNAKVEKGARYRVVLSSVGVSPISERVVSEILSLPMFSGLCSADQQHVGEAVA